ncbi:MAG: ATPase domain-containing protein [Acidilobus sp.]
MGSAGRQRVLLGVPGLDDLFIEGVPRGSIILVAGYPGAGKTTLASQFAYAGAASGEPSLYVSFVEPRDDFIDNALSFGMDFRPLEGRGAFKYYEALSVSDPEALGDVIEDVLSQVDSMGAKRVVLDSVTAVEQLARDPPRAREIMHSALYLGLKRRGATSLLIAELPFGAEASPIGPEEFIADGVIVLKYRVVKNKLERHAEIRKMRGTNVEYASLPYAFTTRGVELPPPLRPEALPSGARYERACRLGRLTITPGMGTLILYDPSVDPVQFSAYYLVAPAVALGLRTRYSSYIHGATSLRDVLATCGDPLQGKLNNLMVESFEASSMTIGEAELRTYASDRDFRPDLVVVEGIHLLREFNTLDDYTGLVYRTLLRRASMGIMTFHLYASPREGAWDVPLSTYYDNVLYLYVKGDKLVLEPLRVWGELVPPREPVLTGSLEADCRSILMGGVASAPGPEGSALSCLPRRPLSSG